MFGWDTPAARVTCYNMQGEPILPTKQKKVSVIKTGELLSQSPIETGFFHTSSDAFAIYQLKGGDSTRHLRFEPLARLQQTGETVDQANYQCVYTAPFPVNVPNKPMELSHFDCWASTFGETSTSIELAPEGVDCQGGYSSHQTDSAHLWLNEGFSNILSPFNRQSNATTSYFQREPTCALFLFIFFEKTVP
ncbi:MAG: YodL domain-containing protein, partial [Clostridia bacterium]